MLEFPKEEELKIEKDISKVTSTSNNLFHLRSHKRGKSESEPHVSLLSESEQPG